MKTFLWTNRHGQKIPLQLMESDYVLNCYARCMEICLAHEVVQRLEKHSEHTYEVGSSVFHEISSSTLTYEQAKLWVERFKAEAARRNLRLPRVDRNNIEQNFQKKMTRKNLKFESNRKFDENYK
jgi:hypothetical protein